MRHEPTNPLIHQLPIERVDKLKDSVELVSFKRTQGRLEFSIDFNGGLGWLMPSDTYPARGNHD